MTSRQLRAVMKFHLKNFNNEGVTISDDTVHSAVLSDSDGFGGANSKAIYKSFIRWTLWNEDEEDPAWPADWMDQNVRDLAEALLAAAAAD
jgi:hypothetical protein